MAEGEYIHVKGARANNLKNFDLSIERGQLVVITGISGSGKSSLAFDTLYAEGHRRFAESLSSFARQFLGRMTKPDVDFISGIPPAIAVEQKVNTTNPRSTVATITEIYDYLQLLYAKIGRTYSPVSGCEVRCDTAQSVLEYLCSLEEGATVFVAARISWDGMEKVEKMMSLKQEGFARLIDVATGEFFRIDDLLSQRADFDSESMMLLVDRMRVAKDDADFQSRALDSIATAFNHGGGYVAAGVAGAMRRFSNIFEADGMTFERPSENLFSYNSPLGACPACGGYGKVVGIDEHLVIPNPAMSVYEGAVACWRGEVMKACYQEVVENAYKFDFPIHRPYNELTKEQKKVLWEGNQYITGINPFFDWVRKNRYKIQYNYMLSRYSGKTECRECEGTRLRKEALYVKIGGMNIAQLMDMCVRDLKAFFDSLELDPYEVTVADRALTEIRLRLGYLMDVGLGYLTLSRAGNTLSGGESQRINLVKSLGNNLVGALYILDEPSIGLHSRDTARLVAVLKKLRDLGNTLIVVEHDPFIMQAADQIIDVGPGAGVLGGDIVYQGPYVAPGDDAHKSLQQAVVCKKDDAGNPLSVTWKYLSGQWQLRLPERRRTPRGWIDIEGACENNLKSINVRFPLGCLTAVTGVSGSGKSTLVGDILYPALYRHLNQMGNRPGAFRSLGGDLDKISQVEYVNQNPIGKSSRSNPVTYLKVYDDIRKLFSEQPYARMNGYGHSHFSFNIDGGRCPECQGEGVIHIEMQFMADVTMVCESCGGRRFLPDILEVKYKGKNISDVLDMSVDEAVAFFSAQEEAGAKRIAQRLQPLVSVGLGYLQLGQSSSTLSGGESQRIKLAYFLSKESSAQPILFIFDEPTTGLHACDIEKLLKAFDALIEKGHTVLVVEHNLDVIRAADHVIELGPDAGDEGGEVIFAGSPDELARHPEIPTGEAIVSTGLRNDTQALLSLETISKTRRLRSQI